jgi:uncharacterized membrane protein YeiH
MSLVSLLDTLALVALGLSGGGLAAKKGMDFYGAMVLAIVTGLGGGMLADVLVDRPPRALYEAWMLPLAAGAGLIAFLLGERLTRFSKVILYLDAVGLGLYAIAGAQRGINAEVSLSGVVLLGVVTGSGGGMLRDVLSGEIPVVLRKEIYALAAGLGALAYGLAAREWGTGPAVGLSAAACVAVVRILAIRLQLNTTLSTRREPPAAV